MRLFSLFLFVTSAVCLSAAPMPGELASVLKEFRAEGPRGWAFVQTTVGGDRTRVERYDPLGKNSLKWTLLTENGKPPTEDSLRKYNEIKTRRSSNETAPNVKDQIIPDSCEIVEETAERGVYRFQLKPGDDSDSSAQFMRATFTLHRPTATIERVELASIGPFSPVVSVKVDEARTLMLYTLPENDRPSFLKEVSVKIRGTTMWFRSMDQDMTVTYSDQVFAGKK